MTQFVPNSYPDFDTDSSGMHVAFRDRGGSHHGLVTYQTGPGGGVEVSVGDISATIPELTAAVRATLAADALGYFAPTIAIELRYVTQTGTKTTGLSTPGDWSDGNCYGSLQSAVNQPTSKHHAIVLSDGIHAATSLTTTGCTAVNDDVISIYSASDDPEKCTVNFSAAATVTAINLNKSGALLQYHFKGIRFTRDNATTSASIATFLMLSQMSSAVVFENCICDGMQMHVTAIGRGLIDASGTEGVRTLTFRNCVFRNITTSGPGGTSSFLSALRVGTSLVLDDVLIEDYQHTVTNDAANFGAVFTPNINHYTFRNVTLRRVRMIHSSLLNVQHAPFLAPQSPVVVDGLYGADIEMTGGAAGAFLLRCSAAFTAQNISAERCVSVRTPAATDCVGGVILAGGDAAIGTVRNLEAIDCIADYGTVIYCTQGGSMVAKSVRAYNCEARGEAMIYSGGWGDFSLKGAILSDCRSGTGAFPSIPLATGGIYAHLHGNATRDKTVDINHVILLSTSTASSTGPHSVGIVNVVTTKALTATVINVVSDSAAERQIMARTTVGSTLGLSGHGSAFKNGAAAYFTEGEGAVTPGLTPPSPLDYLGDGALSAANLSREHARAWTEAMADAA